MQEPPSDAIRTLLMKKKREQSGGATASPAEMDFAYKPPGGAKRARPEDAVPDYPQNRAVREFLKKAPAKGGKVALGEGTVLNQCWRCKLYGHRTGDRSCPYFTVGNLEAEAERQIREDPLMAIAPPPPLPPQGSQAQEKLQELNELLETVRRAEEERRRRKSDDGEEDKKKRKKKKKKKKKKDKKDKKEGQPVASWL